MSNRPSWLPQSVFVLLCLAIFIPVMYGLHLIVQPVMAWVVEATGPAPILAAGAALIVAAFLIHRRDRIRHSRLPRDER